MLLQRLLSACWNTRGRLIQLHVHTSSCSQHELEYNLALFVKVYR